MGWPARESAFGAGASITVPVGLDARLLLLGNRLVPARILQWLTG